MLPEIDTTSSIARFALPINIPKSLRRLDIQKIDILVAPG